jgi:hypothetical protein
MAVIRVVFVIIVINTQKFPTSNNISDWIGLLLIITLEIYKQGKFIREEARYTRTMTIFKGLSKKHSSNSNNSK